MKELRSTIAISLRNRDIIKQLAERDILGFKLASTTDIFMLAVSLGLSDPQPLKQRDPYIRTEYIKVRETAFFESVLLGSNIDEAKLDQYADLEASLDMCEQCAESGFKKLEQLAEDAEWDKETIEKRISVMLNQLYLQYVEADI